jgi:hypothetical protein
MNKIITLKDKEVHGKFDSYTAPRYFTGLHAHSNFS